MRTTDVVKVKEIEELFTRPDNYLEIKEDIASRGIQEKDFSYDILKTT